MESVAESPSEYWRAKDEVLAAIRTRIEEDAPIANLSATNVGILVAPVVDLALTRLPGYEGWFPCGLADDAVGHDHRLRRGTTVRFTGGEQETCCGTSENLLFFDVESTDGAAPQGTVTMPYDLRWSFGFNLTTSVLVGADADVLADDRRLDAIAADIRGIIDAASPRARVNEPDR